MLSTIIKYFFILISCCSFVLKAFNIKIVRKQWATMFSVSTLISICVYIIRQYSSSLSLIFISISLVLLIYFIFKKQPNQPFVISIVSLGASYVLHSVSVLIMSPIIYICSNIIRTQFQYAVFEPLLYITIGCLQLVLLHYLFMIKRLKNSISFLIINGGRDVGAFLSASVLLAAATFNVKDEAEKIYIIPVFFILLCGIILFFVWRNNITHRYIEKEKSNEIEILKKELNEKDKYIVQLEADNNSLAEIIHKDNKIIPIMQVAIIEIISSCNVNAIENEKITSLSDQINEMASARYGIIQKYETHNNNLPVCGIASLDALFKYIKYRSDVDDIVFNISLSVDVKKMINALITIKDLNILLADICENAIIATKGVDKRSILLSISTNGEFYSIEVCDSGVLFDEYTILKIGKERVSTHLSCGGSGIGLMTVTKILKKYEASFTIEEFFNNREFSKKISISFDGANEYRIKSMRQEIIACCSNAPGIILL